MTHLPSGTVTFALATVPVVEGSGVALLVDRHRGYLFAQDADGWSAAFSSPVDALAAAAQAVRSAAAGSDALPSIVVHSGTADPGVRDYAGPTLDRGRCALRLAAPGQILVTHASRLLVDGVLPPDLELLDLGRHRLMDLLAPEALAHLVGAGLPTDFPPPRGLDDRRTNLPIAASRFVGRQRELRELGGLLGTARLVTLTGAGGTGKTRLALHAAAEALEAFPDGVWQSDLGGVADSDSVATAIATACGVREEPDRPIEDLLVEHLHAARTLLVLDAVDRHRDAVARLVGMLLDATSAVRILATAGEPIGLAREAPWRVPPLAGPERADADVPPSQYAAFQLFLERAEAARPGFRVDADSTPAIADLCFRLDGMPLAIEIAAAALHDLPLAVVATELATAFESVRTVDPRTIMPRRQVMRTALAWRLQSLDADARTMLAQLTVFAGGFVVPAVRSVIEGGADDAHLTDRLDHLVDRGLIARVGTETEPRMTLLDPVREVAAETLAGTTARAALLDRHLAHFVRLAERADHELTRADQTKWAQRLAREHDNVRAALEWSIAGRRTESALRLGGDLWRFWEDQGHLGEGRRWLVRILELPGVARYPTALARAHYAAAAVAWSLGDRQSSGHHLARASALFAAAGDQRGQAWVHNDLGLLALGSADYAMARASFLRSLAIKQSMGEAWDLAITWGNLGAVSSLLDDLESARRELTHALELARASGHETLECSIQLSLAKNSLARGDRALARDQLSECDVLARRTGAPMDAVEVRVFASRLMRTDGDLVAAAEAIDVALRGVRALEFGRELGDVLDEAACWAAQAGYHRRAVVLAAAAERSHRRAGMLRLPDVARELAAVLRQSRQAIGGAPAAEAHAEGRGMSPDEAVAFALDRGAEHA